jgi:hypothetical protein
MLFRDTDAIYCENHTKHINAMCSRMQTSGTLKLLLHTKLLGHKGLILSSYLRHVVNVIVSDTVTEILYIL